MVNEFEKAMHFRHACKLFDASRQIEKEQFDFILEAGRMSPSSIGMEHWKFLVVRDQELREKIKAVAWDQIQVTSASELVVILYKKEVRSNTSYSRSQHKKLFGVEYAGDWYRDFIDVRSDFEINSWSAKQCYLAAANMMTAAAYIGIDSCPMEGFDLDALESILPIDRKKYGVALMVPFGYRVNPQQTRIRSEISELVEFLN